MDKEQNTKEITAKQPMNPILIIAIILVVVAVLTYIIPAGSFERIADEATGYDKLDVDSFTFTERNPIGPFQLFESLTVGMQSAAAIIFFLLIVGGTFQVVEATGAMNAAMSNMVRSLKGKEIIFIPICVYVCGLISATAATWEEYLAILPLVYIVCISAGFNSLIAAGCMFCGAASGYAGGMTNAFTVGIAQTIAQIPMFSGMGYRFLIYFVMATITSIFLIAYALRIRKNPELNEMREIDAEHAEILDFDKIEKMTTAHKLIMIVFAASFVVVAFSVIKWGFYMDEMSAIFLITSILIAIIAKMGVNEFIDEFIKGASSMVWIGFIIGMCMSISTIMSDAGILDTLIYYAGKALRNLGAGVGACGMFLLQDILNCVIPSGSGQAAVTMPFMAPLSDVLGISRQVSVLAYQMGDAFTNVITPSAGDMMAALAICHIPYRKWLKFVAPLWALWVVAACVFLVIAVHIGY